MFERGHSVRILISNSSGVPIYEQIAAQIAESIAKGLLKEGDALPSIRQLAKDLRVSVITTTRAYNELENKGLVTAMQGKGYFVSASDSNAIKAEYLKRIKGHLQEAVKDAKTVGIDGAELQNLLKILIERESIDD